MGPVKLFLLPSLMHPVLDFLLQQCAGPSLPDSWTPTKAFSSVGDCQNQCSLRGNGRKLLFHHLTDVIPVLAVANCRPTARRKPDYEPVENTDEAQKKFGNVKAISSDMYFGRQAKADVSAQGVSVWSPQSRKPAGPREVWEEVLDAE